jgi:hypothetical protein
VTPSLQGERQQPGVRLVAAAPTNCTAPNGLAGSSRPQKRLLDDRLLQQEELLLARATQAPNDTVDHVIRPVTRSWNPNALRLPMIIGYKT